MASFEKRVVWSEGMMLLPQHFQQQSRFLEGQLRNLIDVITANAWGIHSIEIDQSLLRTGKFSIVSARGIFPDGTYFELPNTDCMPPAIDINESFLNKTLYLAIGGRSYGQTEISRVNDATKVFRYKLHEVELRDVTDSNSATSAVEVSGLNIALLSDSDDLGAFSCIPIAVVTNISRTREVMLDQEFIMPVLNLSTCPNVIGFLNELSHLIEHRTQALASRVSVSGKASTFEVQDFLLLQSLNRYLPKVKHFVSSRNIAPEKLYLFMVSMLGELATFLNASKLYSDQPDYNHLELTSVFRTLFEQTRLAFSVVLDQNAVQIPLVEKKYGVRVGVVADKTLFNTSGFVLAVTSDLKPEDIRSYLPQQIKIGSVDQIKELVNLQLPGILLNTLAVAPREIPYKRNCVYFELVPKGTYWQALTQSAGIALHISANFPGLVLELWAIRNGEQ